MRFRLLPFVMLAAIAIGGAFCAAAGDKKVDKRVFELRIYHVNPGKMSALHERFRDRTNKLLEKHGMTLVGFWTPTEPKEAEATLYYLVAHPSQEAAQKSWDAFRADPDWQKAQKDSEVNGRLVTKVEPRSRAERDPPASTPSRGRERPRIAASSWRAATRRLRRTR